MLRNAGFNHDLNLSFDGSGGSMRYFVLANYNSNRGFLDNTDLNDGYSTQVEMYSLKLRSNLEAAITKTTTARMNLMGRLMQYQLPNAGVALDDMYDTPSAAFPIRVPGGGWARSQLFANPLADQDRGRVQHAAATYAVRRPDDRSGLVGTNPGTFGTGACRL